MKIMANGSHQLMWLMKYGINVSSMGVIINNMKQWRQLMA